MTENPERRAQQDRAARQQRALDEALAAQSAEPVKKKARAGWYPHPEMADTVRYWNGEAWTAHIAPAANHQPARSPGSTAEPQAPTRPCPYCASRIHAKAQRCPQCSGELRHCSRCNTTVGLTTHQKFVGVLRGGMKTQYKCMRCGKVLDGPRF